MVSFFQLQVPSSNRGTIHWNNFYWITWPLASFFSWFPPLPHRKCYYSHFHGLLLQSWVIGGDCQESSYFEITTRFFYLGLSSSTKFCLKQSSKFFLAFPQSFFPRIQIFTIVWQENLTTEWSCYHKPPLFAFYWYNTNVLFSPDNHARPFLHKKWPRRVQL